MKLLEKMNQQRLRTMMNLTPYMITSFLKFAKFYFQQMDYCLRGCLDLVLTQIVATKVLMIIKLINSLHFSNLR
jgi:hypothetical protein